MFGAVERNKDRLSIQEYSIAQTSLEQIFNQFAAQQEEETGSAAGISEGRPVSVRAVL
jgi:ATP-binding cassette, subfamily A (ABC1), member 3